MEKLLNSLRKHCLSIFTVSRWMDNPQSQRGGGRRAARALCCVVPCFTSWGPGLHGTRSRVFYLDPVPSHKRNVGCWERQSRDCKVLEARRWRWQRQPLQALLAVCALGSLPLAGEARLPREGSSPTPTSLPETSPPWGLSAELAPGS